MESNKSPLLQLIDKVSFFDEFSDSEKHEIINKKSMIKRYDNKGSTIFSEGDKGDSVLVVLAGEICITKSSIPPTEEGRVSIRTPKVVTLATLGVGSLVGEVSLLSEKTRSTGVITSTKVVLIVIITKQDLISFNSSIQSKFHSQFISVLIKRLEDMNEKFGRSQIKNQ
jgi:CRP-like cAMP-binding protein